MTLFLTSTLGGYIKDGDARTPCSLNETNCFLKNLQSRWRPSSRVLFIAASPDEFAANDGQSGILHAALPLSGLPVSCMDICDHRNSNFDLETYDCVILGGGHVPTQNTFFQEIGLKAALARFDGIVISISAGTMNAANTVYAQPELAGEALDPDYRRFIPGLGLTDIMVLPHFQMLRNLTLDGLRILEDITLPDSMGRKLYALVDGSYILAENGASQLYGEGYLIENGVLTQICREDECVALD